MKWTFPQFESAPYSTSTQMDGNEAKLRVRSEAGGETPSSGLAAGIQDQTGNNELKRLMPVAPGEYEAQLDVLEPGVYLTQIGQQTEVSSIQNGTTAGFVVPYSPEYRITNEDGLALLKQIAGTTGGRVLDPSDPKQSFQFNPVSSRVAYDWTRELFITALLLWLVDIAIRRLSIPWGRASVRFSQPFRAKVKSALERNTDAAGNAAASTALSRLRERKTEANRFYGASHTVSSQDAGQSAIAADSPERSNIQAVKHAESRGAAEQNGEAASGATINRLLAAKNKNKR